jgi:hypothetical protein
VWHRLVADPRLVNAAPPLGVALTAFALYLATVSHLHRGDTPLYVARIRDGVWLAPDHLLPGALGGVALAIGGVVAPEAGPYPPLITLSAIVAALAAGGVTALVHRATGAAGPAIAVGAGFACSRVCWEIGTTYELALFPLVPLLAAWWVTQEADRRSAHRDALLVGGLAAVACDLHVASAAALPALTWAMSRRHWGAAATMTATAAMIITTSYGIAHFIHPELSPLVGLVGMIGGAAGPRDPPWHIAEGLGEALWNAPFAAPAGVAFIAVVAAMTTRLWRNEALLGPLALWAAAATVVAARVEPRNFEYFAPVVAVAWVVIGVGLSQATPAVRRFGYASILLIIASMAWTQHRARADQPTDGQHHERAFHGAPARPPRRGPPGPPRPR